LRREEVAQLAGVGTTWYTWLEQGRDVRASREVLGAVAQALRLDPAERQHLFALHGDVPVPRPAEPEGIDDPLRRMLDSLEQQPALVLGRRWDILAWNRAAVALFGDYERLDGDARNTLHMMIANPEHRRRLVDWEPLARTALAMFRADAVRHLGDPDFERLIATLKQASAEFRRWWPKREVHALVPAHKRIAHPTAGRMIFELTTFTIPDREQKLVLYTPLAEEQTIAKLARLLRLRRSRRSSQRARPEAEA
jgi:transcriptional regulator with XRE-family HTH domain